MESHKSKKPTKAELQSIVDTLITPEMKQAMIEGFEEDLKNAHIKGMVQGFEVANQMLLEWAECHTIEEVVEFCRKNVENKDKMEEIVKGVKETIDEFDESMDKLKKVVDNQSEL